MLEEITFMSYWSTVRHVTWKDLYYTSFLQKEKSMWWCASHNNPIFLNTIIFTNGVSTYLPRLQEMSRKGEKACTLLQSMKPLTIDRRAQAKIKCIAWYMAYINFVIMQVWTFAQPFQVKITEKVVISVCLHFSLIRLMSSYVRVCFET